MLNFITNYPWTFGITVAFVLILIGTFLWIIFKGDGWKDRGFMVRNGKRLTWPLSAMPLIIYAENTVPLNYMVALETIVNRINKHIGHGIFAGAIHMNPDETVPNIKILVTMDAEQAPDNPGSTQHQYDKETGAILSVFISLIPGMGYNLALKVLMHEVAGHGLGLAHDESTNSIMHPVVQMRPQELTKKDIERLKETYIG